MPNRTLNLPIRDAAPLFAALGDDVRLTLVARLSKGVPLSITQLTHKLPITRQAVTKHLRVLESAGVVRGEKTGREQLWELEAESLEQAQRYLALIAQQWASALSRLQAFVEER
jgi:DNA-binding transcriptional ArsR family regulator